MAKEIGIPKNAPKKVKAMDDQLDKKKGFKEGSKEDLKADKSVMYKSNLKKKK